MIKRVLAAAAAVAAVLVLPVAPAFADTSVTVAGQTISLPLGNPGCC